MKKVNKISIFSLLLVITALSCEKDAVLVDYIIDGFTKNKYYDAEIFSEPNLDIYDKWELYAVSGGIHGGGHVPNFDFLKMNKYGIYGFIRNDTILEFGRIKIDEQTSDILLITFEPDENSDTFMYDSEKYVNLIGNDTLILESPCCDRYNYHFIIQKSVV